MKDLIIIGGGGHAKEIIWIADCCGRNIKGILDDSIEMIGKSVSNVKIVGSINDWVKYQDCEFVIAIGSPRTRKSVFVKIQKLGSPKFAKLIHPSAIYSESLEIGEGTMICAGAVITIDVKLGSHCILNSNVTVAHDCVFGNFVTLAPLAAISGNVTLNECVEIGTNAAVRQGLTLANGAMLGMGGVLTKDIPDSSVYAGNPARKLKELIKV